MRPGRLPFHGCIQTHPGHCPVAEYMAAFAVTFILADAGGFHDFLDRPLNVALDELVMGSVIRHINVSL